MDIAHPERKQRNEKAMWQISHNVTKLFFFLDTDKMTTVIHEMMVIFTGRIFTDKNDDNTIMSDDGCHR